MNLSARRFLDPEPSEHVRQAMEAVRVSPARLEIELIETAAMADAAHTPRVFGQLRDQGVSIAIDDSGPGYASLNYLHRLPFDKLRIDRELLTDVHAARDAQAICGALIGLARGLYLKRRAKGVEAEEEVRRLSARGCPLFQSFYFVRPLPAEAFEAGSGRIPAPPPADIA